eukprot:6214339-Pleurochrysis_carterae.AAC.3
MIGKDGERREDQERMWRRKWLRAAVGLALLRLVRLDLVRVGLGRGCGDESRDSAAPVLERRVEVPAAECDNGRAQLRTQHRLDAQAEPRKRW